MKRFPRQTVLDTVEKVLAPFVGASLARASAITQSQKLGLDDNVTLNEVDRLLERLGGGIRVFVGELKAAVLMNEIRDAITREVRR